MRLTPKSMLKDIRRKTRRRLSAEETIHIALQGLSGEHSIAELCRREGIAQGLYYTWSKEFLGEADWKSLCDFPPNGKKRLAGRH